MELHLTWPRICTISEIPRTHEVSGANPVNATQTKGATFQINNAKIYNL